MGKLITEEDMKPIIKKWREAKMIKDICKDDEVHVEFLMRVDHIAGKDDKDGQVFGFTEDGTCVSAPISAIVERCPRLGNGGEPIDNGEVFHG